MKKKIYPILSFMIPVMVMILFFIAIGGINSEMLSIGDMQAQHIDMMLFFKRVILGQESVLYSINNGLGGGLYPSMAYYMLSPLNLIIVLFKDGQIMDAIRLILLIKIGLSGLSMYTLLNSKYKNKQNYALLFSLCYTLMAFVINNYFCTLWLDAIYLAPLVVLGIDKLINDKKVLLYMVSLMLSIFTNFYMGYMICVFSVIYFVYSLVIKYGKKDKKVIIETSIRFLISSLLAGLTMAVIYVPALISILKSDRTTIPANETNLPFFIYRMFIGSYHMSDFLSYYHPCLYCGLIVLPLLVLFVYNKKIKEKEKVITFAIIILFIFSILHYQLSYLWHGFSFPIGYNFRFSYLFCLFVILVAYKQICTATIGITKPMKYSLAVLCLIALSAAFKYSGDLNGYLSIALLITYSILLCLNLKKKSLILLIIVLVELTYNGFRTFFVNRDHFTTRQTLISDICNNIPNSDGYRVAGYEYYGTNENVACSFSGLRLFSTTINSRITSFYGAVGFRGGVNMYDDNIENTPLIYSLLGVKYFYSDKPLNNYKLIKEFETTKKRVGGNDSVTTNIYIYENEYALKMGFMIDNYGPIEATNLFEFQSGLLKQIADMEDDILIRLSDDNKGILDSKYIYISVYSDVQSLRINDEEIVGIPAGEIIAVENKYEGKDIKIEGINYDGSSAVYDAYYIDLSKYLTAINTIRNKEISNININKNIINVDITSRVNGQLVLTIPYEDGFTAYVDGEKVELFDAYGVFIGMDLSVGTHHIELVYRPAGLSIGISISAVALLMCAGYAVGKKKKLIK